MENTCKFNCLERFPLPPKTLAEKIEEITSCKRSILKILTNLRKEEQAIKDELGIHMNSEFEWTMTQNYLSV